VELSKCVRVSAYDGVVQSLCATNRKHRLHKKQKIFSKKQEGFRDGPSTAQKGVAHPQLKKVEFTRINESGTLGCTS